MKSKIQIIFLLCLTLLLFANVSHAALIQCSGNNPNGSAGSPCTIGDLVGTVRLIINFLLSWAWLVSMLFIVISGIRMVIAQGNEEDLAVAKAGLSNAIIGFILILLSFVILNLVVGILTGGGLNPSALTNAFNLVP